MDVGGTFRNAARGIARAVLRTEDITETIRIRRLALEKRLYRRPISLGDLRAFLLKLGFARGRVIWVQSSWNEFYNLPAKPSDVLAVMLDIIGPDGTLVMPTFPLVSDPSKVLDIDRIPSATGLLTEIFRRQKGALRSIHLTSAVSALGPHAEYLVRDHHRDVFSWGPLTPYCRLIELEARIVGLGVGTAVTNSTPLHAVECLLYKEVPFFQSAFGDMVTYRWRRRSGEEGEHTFRSRVRGTKLRQFARAFPREMYVLHRMSNLDGFGGEASAMHEHAMMLARKGITIYGKA